MELAIGAAAPPATPEQLAYYRKYFGRNAQGDHSKRFIVRGPWNEKQVTPPSITSPPQPVEADEIEASDVRDIDIKEIDTLIRDAPEAQEDTRLLGRYLDDEIDSQEMLDRGHKR